MDDESKSSKNLRKSRFIRPNTKESIGSHTSIALSSIHRTILISLPSILIVKG